MGSAHTISEIASQEIVIATFWIDISEHPATGDLREGHVHFGVDMRWKDSTATQTYIHEPVLE